MSSIVVDNDEDNDVDNGLMRNSARGGFGLGKKRDGA